jgi:hypothetical protein
MEAAGRRSASRLVGSSTWWPTGRRATSTVISCHLTLERWTARGGRDNIDHPAGGHDDLANAAAGALVLATTQASRPPLIFGCLGDLQVYDPNRDLDPARWDPTVDADEPAPVDA